MVTTLADIDAKLLVASPYLHDACRHDEAVYVCDVLLDARNTALLESWWDLS